MHLIYIAPLGLLILLTGCLVLASYKASDSEVFRHLTTLIMVGLIAITAFLKY